MPIMTRRPTTIRLDPELRPALDAYASKTRRSLNGAVNYLIKRALATLDDSQK